MPRYRKLHTKTPESLDLNDMLDDTMRLFWVLLLTQTCREGRGLDNVAWLKSKAFPLRSDIPDKNIQSYMAWLKERKMVSRYTVDDRDYFLVVNFHKYQGDTSKEAESNFPAPPATQVLKNKPPPDDDFVLEYASEIESFLSAWSFYFTDKPQPRQKTISAKFKTRLKDEYFANNWDAALIRASKSKFLHDSGFFTAKWFIHSDDHWENCLDGNYDDKKTEHESNRDSNREVIAKVAKEFINDES